MCVISVCKKHSVRVYKWIKPEADRMEKGGFEAGKQTGDPGMRA